MFINNILIVNYVGIGDWGLGIGPIPNPQSPIPKILTIYYCNIK